MFNPSVTRFPIDKRAHVFDVGFQEHVLLDQVEHSLGELYMLTEFALSDALVLIDAELVHYLLELLEVLVADLALHDVLHD